MKKILIKQCNDPLMWYANKVGQEVVYLKEYGREYISREDSGLTNMILKEDAEIVEYD